MKQSGNSNHKAVQAAEQTSARPRGSSPPLTPKTGGDGPQQAAGTLERLSSARARLALVLGSGFHHVLKQVQVEVAVPYQRLPGFPTTGVAGHAGKLVIGRLAGTPVLVLSGRAHYYEGYPMTAVTFAIRALAAYGISDLVLTNAAGGVNRQYRPGDFMVLTDHINLMGENPLRGSNYPGLPRFVDLSEAYDSQLSQLLVKAGSRAGLKLQKGTYLAVCGPSYETPAEIRAYARLGADAVGMSTVPETIVARQCGLRVAGLSCITNLASGRSQAPLSHDEVLQTAEKSGPAAAKLLCHFAEAYGKTAHKTKKV